MAEILTNPIELLHETLRLDQPDTYLGRGKDAEAFLAAPGLVYRRTHPSMYIHFDEATMDKLATRQDEEVEAYASLPPNTGVARTVLAWVADGQVHKIIEQAPGNKLYPWFPNESSLPRAEVQSGWEASISLLASVPQSHYDLLIKTEAALRERHILVDTAGMADMHYHPEKGFVIVDAEFKAPIPLRGKTIYAPIIGAPALVFMLEGHDSWQGIISSQAQKDVCTVLGKLSTAGHHPRWWMQFRRLCEIMDYDPPVKNPDRGE